MNPQNTTCFSLLLCPHLTLPSHFFWSALTCLLIYTSNLLAPSTHLPLDSHSHLPQFLFHCLVVSQCKKWKKRQADAAPTLYSERSFYMTEVIKKEWLTFILNKWENFLPDDLQQEMTVQLDELKFGHTFFLFFFCTVLLLRWRKGTNLTHLFLL